MAIQQTVARNAPEIGGGVVGVGVPVALRETLDVRDGQVNNLLGEPDGILGRISRPSSAWGIGVGSLTGALWAMDVGPQWLHDFYLTHSITGIPTGIASAAMPRSVDGGSGGGSGATVSRSRRMTRQSSDGETGDFDPADGGIEPAQ